MSIPISLLVNANSEDVAPFAVQNRDATNNIIPNHTSVSNGGLISEQVQSLPPFRTLQNLTATNDGYQSVFHNNDSNVTPPRTAGVAAPGLRTDHQHTPQAPYSLPYLDPHRLRCNSHESHHAVDINRNMSRVSADQYLLLNLKRARSEGPSSPSTVYNHYPNTPPNKSPLLSPTNNGKRRRAINYKRELSAEFTIPTIEFVDWYSRRKPHFVM
jgi:hypothetical protein